MVYVITFTECPLLWVSKIQTEVALSNLHFKYVALYQSLRDSLILNNLINETIGWLNLDDSNHKFILKPTVYEDNHVDIQADNRPRINPTSKKLAVKYHWFQEHVGRYFYIKKIDSKRQEGDFSLRYFKEITCR